MIYYPDDTEGFAKLRKAANSSYRNCNKLRQNRLAAVKEYVGGNYADGGSDQTIYLNLLEFAINTYARQLIANNPQILVTTKFPELRPSASMFQSALNQLLIEIEAHDSFKAAVLDALFGVGVIKVGISEDARQEILGQTHVLGVPFMDHVDTEDMIFDTTATQYHQQSFVGNVYRMPTELALESGLFDEEALDAFRQNHAALKATKPESIKSVFEGDEGDLADGADSVEFSHFAELWLPHENVVVTALADPFSRELQGTKPLRLDDYTGPKSGPYHYLGFIDVPGQLIPNNPSGLWIDTHRMINASYRKLVRQTARQKDVFTYKQMEEQDARNIVMAEDGQVVQSNAPDAIQTHKFGGADKDAMATMLQFKQNFSELAGNLDSLGGIAPSANTLGQESMLAEASNRRVQEMQDRVITFVSRCIRSLGEHLWAAPGQSVQIERKLEMNGEVQFQSAVDWPNPSDSGGIYPDELREGPFANYDLNIEPYSMSHSSPAEKLQVLDAVMQNELLPASEQLAQQGLFVDWRKYLKLKAHYSGVGELEEILVDQQNILGQPEGEQSGQPSFTGNKGKQERTVQHNYEGVRNRRSDTKNKVKEWQGGSDGS